nr:Tn3 family transposase [Klebsiella pneumoniae]
MQAQHPRRNLQGGTGRAGQRAVPTSAGHWGDGTTSSSDGQNFRTGSKAESTGHINPKYGSSPGGRSTPISPTSTRRSTPGRERRRARLDLRARRPAVSRIRPADRGTTPTRQGSRTTSSR